MDNCWIIVGKLINQNLLRQLPAAQSFHCFSPGHKKLSKKEINEMKTLSKNLSRIFFSPLTFQLKSLFIIQDFSFSHKEINYVPTWHSLLNIKGEWGRETLSKKCIFTVRTEEMSRHIKSFNIFIYLFILFIFLLLKITIIKFMIL